MATVIQIDDRTGEAQRGIAKLSDLLDQAAKAEDSFLEAARRTDSGLEDHAISVQLLTEIYGKLNTRINALVRTFDKHGAEIERNVRLNQDFGASLELTSSAADAYHARLREVDALLKEFAKDASAAGKAAGSSAAGIDRASRGKNGLAGASKRSKAALSEEEQAQKSLDKVFNAGLTPLQRLLERKKELLALEGKEIASTQRYAEAKRNLDAQITRAYRRQEIQDGRTLSEQLDTLASKMSVLPGQIGRVGSSLGMVNHALGGVGATSGQAASGISSVVTMSTGAALGAGLVAAGGLAIVGSFIAAGFHSKEFTKNLRTLQNVSGATGKELDLLHDSAINAGIATQFMPTQALEGLQELASLGFKAKDSTDLLLPVLDLAAAGNLSVGEAAGVAGSTLKAYGIGVDGARSAMDKLVGISNQSAIQFSDLTTAISKSASGANVANQSLDEMLVTMGLAKNAGLGMEEAATGINSALLHMAGEGRKEFDKLGIQLEDGQGNFRKFGDILVDLTAKTKTMGDVQRAQALHLALGTYGVKAATPILKQLSDGIQDSTGNFVKNGDAIAYLREQIASTDGTLAKFRDNQLDTLDGQLTLLHGSIDTFTTLIGEETEAGLKNIVSFAVGAVNTMIDAVNGAKLAFKSLFGEQEENTRSKQLGDIQAQIDEIEPKIDKLKWKLLGLRQDGDAEGLAKANAEYSGMQRRMDQLVHIRKELTAGARDEAVQQQKVTDQIKKTKSVSEDSEKAAKKAANERKKGYEDAGHWIERTKQSAEEMFAAELEGIERVERKREMDVATLEKERDAQLGKAKGRSDLEIGIWEAYGDKLVAINNAAVIQTDEIKKKARDDERKRLQQELKERRDALDEYKSISATRIELIEIEGQKTIQKYRELARAKALTEEEAIDAIRQVNEKTDDEINKLRSDAVKKAQSYSMTEVEQARSQADEEIAAQKEALDQKLINEEQYQAAKAAIESRYNQQTLQAGLAQAEKYAEMAGRFASMVTDYFTQELEEHKELGEKTAAELKDVNDQLAKAEFEQQKISLQAKKGILEKKLAAEQAAAAKAYKGQQIAAVSEAVIQGAIAEMKLTAMYPPVPPTLVMWGIGTGLIIAETALAVGKILSQPAPTFHSGVASRGGVVLAPDETMARVLKRESVLTPTATDTVGVDTINELNGGATFKNRRDTGRGQNLYSRFEFRREHFDTIVQDGLERRGPIRNLKPNEKTRWGMR